MSALRCLVVALVLALVLAPALPPMASAAAPSDAQPAPNPLATIGKESVKAFIERPLFEPSRRPPPVAEPPIAPPPPPELPAAALPALPTLRLIGVIEGEGSRAAIVLRLDTNRTELLHTGDQIDGWSVEVMPSALRIADGDRAFEYAMFRSAQAGPIAIVPVAADQH